MQAVLGAAVVLGAFVYPLSLAMRGAGSRIAAECERGHAATLRQVR